MRLRITVDLEVEECRDMLAQDDGQTIDVNAYAETIFKRAEWKLEEMRADAFFSQDDPISIESMQLKFDIIEKGVIT